MTSAGAGRHAWVDATAGVAGDMLLAALVDAGAPLANLQGAVDAVIPESIRLASALVSRAGMRATKVDVHPTVNDQVHRSWRDIQALLDQADLAAPVREQARRVFGRLAEAEARVHGVAADEVHFHEAGGWDSIADVVAACAALDWLGVTSMSCSAVALGSGRVAASHGELPVPVPAVLEMSAGWRVLSGGEGELATPTGMALLTALSQESGDLPAMSVHAIGVGAGTADVPGRANVVRVVLGDLTDRTEPPAQPDNAMPMSVLETNVDDMDPRVWPTVLASLLDAGAADAWLVPIVMKKGRPAHTLAVLTPGPRRAALRRLIFELTSTIGVREVTVTRMALDRFWVPLPVAGGQVRLKVAHRDGEVVHATPEFDDAAEVAAKRAVPVRRVIEEAVAAAEREGLVPGRRVQAELCGGRDLGGQVPGPVAVVDVDHGHAGRTGVEHGQQGRQAPERRAVADGRRHRDHRRGDEAGHQAGQRAVHPGDHDDDPGRPQLVQPGQDAMQPGDADIGDQIGGPAEVNRGQLRLPCDSEVGGTGRDHQDPSAVRRRRLGRPGQYARVFVVAGIRQDTADRLGVRGTRTGEQRRRAGCLDGPGGGTDLAGCLALAVDRLRVATATRPVMVRLDERRHGLIGLPGLTHARPAAMTS